MYLCTINNSFSKKDKQSCLFSKLLETDDDKNYGLMRLLSDGCSL